MLLVAAGSATAGIVSARDTHPTAGQETIVATSPIVTAPMVTTVAAPRRESTTTTTASPAPAPKKGSGALVEWPERDGYTVVVASIPARGAGLRDATATANAVVARGLRQVGVLVSSRFASLHPGYYVVFAGIYSTLQDAQAAVGRVISRFPNAYAREITH